MDDAWQAQSAGEMRSAANGSARSSFVERKNGFGGQPGKKGIIA